ncbi:hypothetical protein HFP64_03535 [Bacillus sp. AC79A.1]
MGILNGINLLLDRMTSGLFEYKYLGKKPSNENERRKFEEMKEYEEQNKS